MIALAHRLSGEHVLALLVAIILAPMTAVRNANADETLLRFTHLLRTETWTERWLSDSGEIETRMVTAAIWNDAIQAALDKDNTAHIPKLEQPYYLDGPIVLKSGQKLIADWMRRFGSSLAPTPAWCATRTSSP